MLGVITLSKKLTFEEVEKIILEKSNYKCKLNNYTEAHNPMDIECKCGNTFSVLIGNFKKGKVFCNDCLCDIRRQKQFDNILSYIFSCGNIVLSKSNEYDDEKSKLKILCKCGNVFRATLRKYKFSNKRQCNDCGYGDVKYNKRNIMDVYDLFRKKGLIPMFSEDDYKNTNSSLAFKCTNHIDEDIQFTSYSSLGRDFAIGCTHCRNEKLREEFKEKNPREYFIEKGFIPLFENHEYLNSSQQLPFICKVHEIHGEQTTSLSNVKAKKGCKYCADSKSKGEIRIKEYLNQLNTIQYKMENTLPNCKYKIPLKFDFLIIQNDKLKLAIEYDGQQHFEPVDFAGKGKEWAEKRFIETKKCDQIKNQYCNENDIPLLRIPYWEFDNIEEILEKEFASLVI